MRKFFNKLILFVLLLILTLSLAACGGKDTHEGEAKTPSGSSIQEGQDYKEVIENFKEKGFTNIKTEKIEDLITGWLIKDGEVEEVSVDNDVNYSSDEWVLADTEIVIKYHTFASDSSDEPKKDILETTEPETTIKSKPVDDDLVKDLKEVNDNEEDTSASQSIYELAYEKSNEEYSIYYLIDIDEKIIRNFTTNDTGVLYGTYTGSLNSGIDINYNGGDMHEQIQFNSKDDDSSITLIDPNGFDWQFNKTSVSKVEEIINQDGYKDITSY